MAPKSKSQPQSQGSQKKPKASRAKTVKLDGSEPSSSAPTKLTRLDPLTAFSKHLAPSTHSTNQKTTHGLTPVSKKIKGKEKIGSQSLTEDVDNTLWVDRYEPKTEAELAVHVKKVDNLRQWFREAFEGGPSGTLKKYRRILTLTGPAGTGKTSTIRILAQEMGFEVLEWRSSVGETSSRAFDDTTPPTEFDTSFEGLFTKFEAFLTRASTCNSIFSEPPSPSSSKRPSQRRIILLEDLPNILHQKTQAQFHQALLSFVNSPPSNPPVPLVIIISDAGVRGEDRDERMTDGHSWGKEKNQVVDVRTVIPKDLLSSAYVVEISFNPIAPTLLRKALQWMLNTHFSSNTATSSLAPSKEVLDAIIESANGDIRSAIMALQFACIVEIPGLKKARGKAVIMEAVTRREQSLALFHLIGKVLYNKRKGDPPNASATAKDLQKERGIDALLKDPVKLPSHLECYERRTSRVDVDTLYADSPIDSSLFSLYIHQNYTQFCNDVDECAGVSDWLSWVDSSGGEAWYQANPHQFHLLSLGTLHSLPSPVQRRSQKYFKPEFFSFLQKEKDAWDGVHVTRDWLFRNELSVESSGWRAGGWSKADVILELGGILKAKDAYLPTAAKPPTMHRLFSKMEFTRGGNTFEQLNENDFESPQHFGDDAELVISSVTSKEQQDQQEGGWLESDDIEES